jgi:hypothetical protein
MGQKLSAEADAENRSVGSDAGLKQRHLLLKKPILRKTEVTDSHRSTHHDQDLVMTEDIGDVVASIEATNIELVQLLAQQLTDSPRPLDFNVCQHDRLLHISPAILET